MQNKRVFDQDEAITPVPAREHTSAVIIELNGAKAARIRQTPPDVLVMVVESKEITAADRRTVVAGGRGEVLSTSACGTATDARHGTEIRQIPVTFPG